MRVIALLAVLCLVQLAVASQISGDGVTILKPTSAGDASNGVTVMSPSGTVAANSACASGSCSSSSMQPVTVIGGGCDCEHLDVCGCRKQVQYVQPELKKEDTCGCHAEPVCGCRGDNVVASTSSSPVVADTHWVKDDCGCMHLEVCGCRKQEYVQPELKQECGCAAKVDEECACSHFRPNL